MKHLIMNKDDVEGSGAGGAGDNKPDVSKVLETGFKNLQDQMNKLSARLDSQTKPQPTQKKKQVEDDDEIDLILEPKKAVNKIKEDLREEFTSSMRAESAAQTNFNNKFNELYRDYPEISDNSSDLYIRAREIMTETAASQYDSAALERAVLKAASEKGLLPMKHRKQTNKEDDDIDDGYLGSPRHAGGERRQRRKDSEKLDARTLAFAAEVGMDVKDPKVIERLTGTQNARRGKWNKFS